jgi:bacterioferritin
MTMTSRDTGRDETVATESRVVDLVTRAYWMELETVTNYLAASANLDGIRAGVVARALEDDVAEELGHARRLARRLRELDAVVPGSLEFRGEQESLQPPLDRTDVPHVLRGVLDAEEAAIACYRELIEEADGADWVTQDLAVSILADEEAHRRLFRGYLSEYEASAGRDGA